MFSVKPGITAKLVDWLKMYKTTDGKGVNQLAHDEPTSGACSVSRLSKSARSPSRRCSAASRASPAYAIPSRIRNSGPACRQCLRESIADSRLRSRAQALPTRVRRRFVSGERRARAARVAPLGVSHKRVDGREVRGGQRVVVALRGDEAVAERAGAVSRRWRAGWRPPSWRGPRRAARGTALCRPNPRPPSPASSCSTSGGASTTTPGAAQISSLQTQLEQEQEYIVNKLQKQLSTLLEEVGQAPVLVGFGLLVVLGRDEVEEGLRHHSCCGLSFAPECYLRLCLAAAVRTAQSALKSSSASPSHHF